MTILTAKGEVGASCYEESKGDIPLRSESFLVTFAVCLLKPITVLLSQSSLMMVVVMSQVL